MSVSRRLWTWRAFLISSFVTSTLTADFTMNCPTECKCVWASGNKLAECTNANFHEIPKINPEIQILEMTGNELYEISRHAFEEAELNNLKKLVLRECKLLTIHKNGLSGLAIMIELDLSRNDLTTLHPETFREATKIRWIFLNDNKLEKLEDGLFNNLPFLQKVDLSNNRLLQIGLKTFMNVPKLNNLRLDGNRLEYLKMDTLSSLTSLSTLKVNDNPWRCDCFLQPFRNWVISKNLYTSPISCAEPAKVHGKLWKALDSSDFACKPNIVYPVSGMTVRSSEPNVTLSCKVNGNPVPEVKWIWKSRILDGSYSYQEDRKYSLSQGSSENSRWVNITIIEASDSDNGEYVCAAKNPGGIEESVLKLIVSHVDPGVVLPNGISNNMLPVLIGVSCTAAILLIMLVFLCYCCCRRRNTEKKVTTSNGDALIEGSVIPEMEKSLISAVNPVTKPPRRYDVPPSITSGATEMSELNKTLLDNDSVSSAHHDEDKRSLDFEHQMKRSNYGVNMDYTLPRSDSRAYPPDLLAFPSRAAQISPAASNASTVPDTTRLPPQLNPLSPTHSSIYGITSPNPNIYKTMPYSRSQSPFVAPVSTPVIMQRQGYVTIPRRPRVPSWSSTASTQILPSIEAQEPLYDNLGLRTTADGSSVLSLNKTGTEKSFSPMKNRPLPATPATYASVPYYAPIEESELTPVTPQYPQHPKVIATSQKTSPSSPGPQAPVNPRMSWAGKSPAPQPEPRRTLFNGQDGNRSFIEPLDSSTLSRRGKPETGSLRRPFRSENKEDINNSFDERSHRDTETVSEAGTLGRSNKIPPRPPPKPKKKPIVPDQNSSEPLFEDEGEDGTEV